MQTLWVVNLILLLKKENKKLSSLWGKKNYKLVGEYQVLCFLLLCNIPRGESSGLYNTRGHCPPFIVCEKRPLELFSVVALDIPHFIFKHLHRGEHSCSLPPQTMFGWIFPYGVLCENVSGMYILPGVILLCHKIKIYLSRYCQIGFHIAPSIYSISAAN